MPATLALPAIIRFLRESPFTGHTADAVLNHYISVEQSKIPYLAGAAYTARDSLYPIPSLQIELSKIGTQDKLVQNPSW